MAFTKAKPFTKNKTESTAETVLTLSVTEGQYGEYGIGSMLPEDLEKFGAVATEALEKSPVGKIYFNLTRHVNKESGKSFYTLKVKPGTK